VLCLTSCIAASDGVMKAIVDHQVATREQTKAFVKRNEVCICEIHVTAIFHDWL
jgi:hypothetical protein